MNKNIKNFELNFDTNIAIVGSPYYKSIYDNLLNGTLNELSNYNINVEILNALGVNKIILLTNSGTPKLIGLEGYGLKILKTIPIKKYERNH